MLVWKALHVLSMVTMITAFIGSEIFYASAMWRRDVHALAFVQRTLERLGIGFIALGALFLGVVFGLITAANGGFDYVAPWLIVAYVLVAVFLVNGFAMGQQVVEAGKAAMEAESATGAAADGTGTGTALEITDSLVNRSAALLAINGTLFAVIVADMVLKPGI